MKSLKRIECWLLAVLVAAFAGNASAAALDIVGVGDDMMRVIVRIIGSLAGAILAVTTIPPSENDATKSRFAMLLGAFAAGVVFGGVMGEYFAPKIGLDANNNDIALMAHGSAAILMWFVLRFVGRSAAKINDMDGAISLWGRLMAAKEKPATPRKRGGTRRG